MKEVIKQVEEVVVQKWNHQYFAFVSIIFPLWYIANTVLYVQYLDVWYQITSGVTYIGAVFLNIYCWRKISAMQDMQSLKPNALSYLRYLLLFPLKEGRAIDKAKNINLKYMTMILFNYFNIIVHMAITNWSEICFDQVSNTATPTDRHIIYGFMLISIGFQAFCNCEILHQFSDYSRYRISKTRNILKFIFVYCSIYSFYVLSPILPGGVMQLGFLIAKIGTFIITAFLIAYYHPFEIPIFSMGWRIYLKGITILILFYMNFELYIYPIYNKILSTYDLVTNNLGYRVYRIVCLLRFLGFGILAYINYHDNFMNQNYLWISISLCAIYIGLIILFLLYDIFQACVPRSSKVLLSQLLEFQYNQQQQDLHQYLVISNSEDQYDTNFLSNQLEKKQKRNCLHQVTQIKYEILTAQLINQHLQSLLTSIISERNKGNYVLGDQDNNNWFAKDGKHIVLNINRQNIDIIIQTFRDSDLQKRYLIYLTMNQEIPNNKQEQLILAFLINIQMLSFYLPKKDNICKSLLYFINSCKELSNLQTMNILVFNKLISPYQYINPKIILYDLYDF